MQMEIFLIYKKNVDFKTETIIKDEEGHLIMIKGSIQQEDITQVNTYAPKVGTPKYIKQILADVKRDIDSNTVGDFNTPLTSVDRSFRQKINRETVALNDTLDQMDLIDIFRAFHLKAVDYTFFSTARRMYFEIDHI